MERSTEADARISSLKDTWWFAKIKEDAQDRLWKEATVICKKRTPIADSNSKCIEFGKLVWSMTLL